MFHRFIHHSYQLRMRKWIALWWITCSRDYVVFECHIMLYNLFWSVHRQIFIGRLYVHSSLQLEANEENAERTVEIELQTKLLRIKKKKKMRSHFSSHLERLFSRSRPFCFYWFLTFLFTSYSLRGWLSFLLLLLPNRACIEINLILTN